MALYIGTSGWSERKGSQIASRVSVAEIRSSFDRPLEMKTVERWLTLVQPYPDFRFTAVLGRQFSHERLMAGSAIDYFKKALWPMVNQRRICSMLIRFPGNFHFSIANEKHLIQLRRSFHEFPLVAELPHESWSTYEARAVLIDRRIGLTGDHLTSGTGYLRVPALHEDLDLIEEKIRRMIRLADQTIVIFEDEVSATEMLARMKGLSIAPAQRGFSFDRAVA